MASIPAKPAGSKVADLLLKFCKTDANVKLVREAVIARVRIRSIITGCLFVTSSIARGGMPSRNLLHRLLVGSLCLFLPLPAALAQPPETPTDAEVREMLQLERQKDPSPQLKTLQWFQKHGRAKNTVHEYRISFISGVGRGILRVLNIRHNSTRI